MGSAAPLAADFGGTAAATSAPLMAGASAAVPNVAAGFPGATGFPATGDILTASAPNVLPGGTDVLAPGAGSWGAAYPDVTAPGGAVPAYGAATDPTAPAVSPYSAIATGEGIGANVTQDPAVANYANATAASPSPYSGPSFTDQVTDALNSPWTKIGLAAAPLAIGLSGIGQKLPASAQQAQANYAALAGQGANLNPSQQAVLGQMRQNLTNQWKQTLFNQGVQAGKGGVPMSTQWPQIQGLIDQQVAASAQQMIQQNIQNALQGNAGLIQLANLQMQQDRNFQATLQNATRALGLAAGLGGQSRTITTTTTTPTTTA